MGLTVTSGAAQIPGARSAGRLNIVQWLLVLSAQSLQFSPLPDQNVHHFTRIEQNAPYTSDFSHDIPQLWVLGMELRFMPS